MLLCIRHTRPTICKKHSEPIAWHNQNADINLPAFDRAPKVHHVHDDKIATRGHLDLNTNADPRAIDRMTARPVDITRSYILPGFREPFIDEASNGCAPIGVPLLFHLQRELGQNLSEILQGRRQSKTRDSFLSPVVVVLLYDLRHLRNNQSEVGIGTLEHATQPRWSRRLQIRKVISKALADRGTGDEFTTDPETSKSLRSFVR